MKEAPRTTRVTLPALLYLLIMLACLGLAVVVQNRLFEYGRDYYASISPGLDSVLGPGAAYNPRPLGNCDIEQCVRQLSGKASTSGVKVGACDLFMYNGSVAVASFLAFLQVYVVFLLGAWLTTRWLPRTPRQVGLLVWSLAFLLLGLPFRPALWLVGFVAALWGLLGLPLGGRTRAVLLGGVTAGFYLTAGHAILGMCGGDYFSTSRIYVSEGCLEMLRRYVHVNEASLNAWFVGSHLGQLNQPRLHDQGFPFLFLGLAFLLKQFRRILWLGYELWTGRYREVSGLDFALYMLGLPTLLGNAATPSLRTFVDAASDAPDVELAGARTLAWCLGGATLLYTCITMLGYFPAVRVLFPNCDIETAGPRMVWGKLATQYVVAYLFLMATEQASVGVARLFGYQLRDNYDRPLLSHSISEFWRRWNIYFREYHVALTFLPTALGLARREGVARRWHLAVAGGVTFFFTFVLNVLPLALLGGWGQFAWHPSDLDQTGAQTLAHELAQASEWKSFVPSLALYYLVEGLAVSVALMLEFQRPRAQAAPMGWKDGGWKDGGWKARAWHLGGVLATFAFVAGARCLLDTNLSFTQQTRLLLRALGLYHA